MNGARSGSFPHQTLHFPGFHTVTKYGPAKSHSDYIELRLRSP